MVHMTFDPVAHAAYIRVCDSQIASTVEVSDSINVDVDAGGVPVGIEILGVESGQALSSVAGLAGVLEHFDMAPEVQEFVASATA